MVSSPHWMGRVVSYLALMGISHISMPCSIYNNVDEKWPQYFRSVSDPLIISTLYLVALQLNLSRPVLGDWVLWNGEELTSQLVLLCKLGAEAGRLREGGIH